MKDIKRTGSNGDFDFFEGIFKDNTVRFAKRKVDGEIFIHPDDFAKIQGFTDFNTMMSDDKVLDKYSDYMKTTGKNFKGESLGGQ